MRCGLIGGRMTQDITVIKVWDAPVRIIHWALVFLVIASWLTAELELLTLHHLSGYLVLSLVLTRIVWGFVGSTTARFSHFVQGRVAISAAIANLFRRDAPAAAVGHNPLGALSVLALLGLLLVQAVLGLFVQDADGIAPGPLADLIPRNVGRALAEVHESVFGVLVALIILHLTAILFHTRYKNDTLLRPMVTGRKQLPVSAASGLRFVPGKWAVLIFVLLAAAVFSIAAF
jgi:cytochrome b